MPAALSEYLSRVAMDDVSVVVISSLFPCYIRHMVKRELLRAVHGIGAAAIQTRQQTSSFFPAVNHQN